MDFVRGGKGFGPSWTHKIQEARWRSGYASEQLPQTQQPLYLFKDSGGDVLELVLLASEMAFLQLCTRLLQTNLGRIH
jgi:hypothetical protein